VAFAYRIKKVVFREDEQSVSVMTEFMAQAVADLAIICWEFKIQRFDGRPSAVNGNSKKPCQLQ
jgi:hypothetical protein